jgi:hypothetical protein
VSYGFPGSRAREYDGQPCTLLFVLRRRWWGKPIDWRVQFDNGERVNALASELSPLPAAPQNDR